MNCSFIHILGIITLLTLSGCEHKELCYDHPHMIQLKVVFDWTKAPDASPESMSLYLFPQNGRKVLHYELPGHEGGTIRVPEGRYEALCLNSDTEGVYCRNTNQITTFEVTTRSTTLLSDFFTLKTNNSKIPRAKGTENERIALAPEELWSSHEENILLEQTSENQTIRFCPEVSTQSCTVEIHNAENLKFVSKINATISTMAGGLLAGTGPNALSEEHVTIPFKTTVSPDKTVITGSFRTFGHCPSSSNSHKLVIYTVLTDNSKWYYTFDVTKQIHTVSVPQNIHIRLENLPIPKPITGSGGFNPSVDDWKDMEIKIEM